MVSKAMSRVRSENTSPELEFQAALESAGVGYEKYAADVPGKPDLVLREERVAIFIDGDYWHGNQWKRRQFTSLDEQFENIHSKDYWVRKIKRNVERDISNTKKLSESGWRVVRLWESDLKKDLERCVSLAVEAKNSSDGQRYGPNPADRTYAEFFAGIGLLGLALRNRRWQPKFANDIDPLKQEMYIHNFPDASEHFVLGDVHNLDSDSIPAVTMFSASFPCNDLSVAGAQAGIYGKQSGAIWGVTRLLENMGDRRPPLVLLENVLGFLTSCKGDDLLTTLKTLNDLGYWVDIFAIDAVHFVPQSRSRFFVIAVQPPNDQWVRDVTAYRPESSDVRPKPIIDFIETHPEVRWAVRRLPALPTRKLALADVLEDLTNDSPFWWDEKRADYLRNQMSARHAAIADRMVNGEEVTYGTVFRRVRRGKSMAELRVDGVAGCLRTPRGGSGRQILFKAGKGDYKVRLLTPRECARLMGVTDDYVINVPLNQALFGFGDAVCVPVIEWMIDNYLDPIVSELLRSRVLYRAEVR